MMRMQAALVLEDQPLIALDVEEILRGAGFGDVRMFFSCAEARRWLNRNEPAFAVLETRLRDGTCEEIAQTLAGMNVPFIVHSVERCPLGVCSALSKCCRWIEKPASPDTFIPALRRCFPGQIPGLL